MINWFAKRFVVLFCMWGMVSISLASTGVYENHKPQRCEWCCPPTGCVGYQQYYNTSMYAHVVPTNQMWNGIKPTKAELIAAIADIGALNVQWADDGVAAAVTTYVINLGYAKFMSLGGNAQTAYSGQLAYGSQVTLAWLNAMLGQATEETKQQVWDVIDGGGGITQLIKDYQAQLTVYANRAPGAFQIFNKLKKPQGGPNPYFSTLIYIGAVIALIGATGGGAGFILLGTMIALGGTTGNWASSFFPPQ